MGTVGAEWGLRGARRYVTDVYDTEYEGVPNWDIGRPQRAFVMLEKAGLVKSPVLDVGCGTGELALFFAKNGHEVLGLDLSSLAIEKARKKARRRGIDAEFLVWDALDLPALAAQGRTFRTVVDSAMFHQLDDRERTIFIEGLGSIVPSEGLYCVLGDVRSEYREQYGITPAELRRRFARVDGWDVVFSYETVLERRWSKNLAYFIGVRRT